MNILAIDIHGNKVELDNLSRIKFQSGEKEFSVISVDDTLKVYEAKFGVLSIRPISSNSVKIISIKK